MLGFKDRYHIIDIDQKKSFSFAGKNEEIKRKEERRIFNFSILL